MKKFLFIMMIFCVTQLGWSQSQVKEKSVQYLYSSFHEDGTVKEVLSFNESGELDGTCKTFSVDGTVESVAHYTDGVKTGVWIIGNQFTSSFYLIVYKDGIRKKVSLISNNIVIDYL
jgi:antitoxin component YwqK of YwqJK toxin-antitoxin module